MNKLNILYEDNHIIVVVKPINILSQADNTKDIDMLSIVKDYIKVKYNKPGNVYVGLVHRLDRVVGGIMVFAKTSKAASRLSEQIRLNKVNKTYLAIVHNKPKDKDILKDYLLKKNDFNTIVTNSKLGKESILDYELLEYNKKLNISLLKINLHTGRHHQIRVQFSSRNYPLVGDNRYGNDNYKEIGLCCYKLEFNHPTTKELLSFTYKPETSLFNKFNYINNLEK